MALLIGLAIACVVLASTHGFGERVCNISCTPIIMVINLKSKSRIINDTKLSQLTKISLKSECPSIYDYIDNGTKKSKEKRTSIDLK